MNESNDSYDDVEANSAIKPPMIEACKRNRRKCILFTAIGLVAVAIVIGITVPLTRKEENTIGSSTNNEGNNENVETNQEGGSNYIQVNSLNTINLPQFSPAVLQGYDSCSDLEMDITEAAKYLVKSAIKRYIEVGVTEEPIYFIESDVAMQDAMPAPEIAQESTSTSERVKTETQTEDSYGTNNQVEAVDEADIVKSDGKHIFAAYGSELVVLSTDGKVLTRTKPPKIENDIPEVDFLETDESEIGIMAYSKIMPVYDEEVQNIDSLLLDEGRIVAITKLQQYWGRYPKLIRSSMTAAYVYAFDPSNNKLNLVDTKLLRGDYQDARSIKNTAHIVTNTYIDSWVLEKGLSRYNEMYWGLPDEEYKTLAEAKALYIIPRYAKQLMAELFGNKSLGGDIDENGCRHIVKISTMQSNGENNEGDVDDPTSGSGILNGFAQVLSFDMQSNLFFQSKGVAGAFLPTSSMDLYASSEMLVFGGHGWSRKQFDWTEYTYLMGFDLSTGIAKPAATGIVPGYVLNQFAMDFFDNHLRVATTNSAKWGVINDATGEWGQTSPSENQVFVLEKQGDEFKETGKVTNLGKGERIYAVRFLGNRGFVVTFRTVDPLYTLDLSNPSNPRMIGELKIPGFSNYLHPVEDNYLLAVGQDANSTTGALLGLQISLFDVTDLANPIQLQKTVVEGWSSSQSQYDHHAFRYLPISQVLILPVSYYDYKNKNSFDGFYIYDIDKNDGIKKLGEVVHADDAFFARYNCFSRAYLDPRSLVFDSNLITLKGHTVEMNGNVRYPEEQWTINLDENMSQMECYPWFPWF